MKVQTQEGEYVVGLQTDNPKDFGKKGQNLENLRTSLRKDGLCLVQDNEYSTIGFGRMASPFKLFFMGGQAYVRRDRDNNGYDSLIFGLDVQKTRNTSTGQDETLVVSGDNSNFRKQLFYSVDNLDFVPINLGTYREMRAYNENTFSSAGPTQWMEHESAGTTGIDLRQEHLQRTFKRCLDDLDFRTHAMEVSIPFSYLPPEINETFCGGPITIGSVDRVFYKTGIQDVYALNEMINALGNLSGRIFNEGGIFNVNMDRQRRDKTPELSSEYFSYHSRHNQDLIPQFLFRSAPGKRGTVWIKPRNAPGKVVLQVLPEYLRQKFPEDKAREKAFDTFLFNLGGQLRGKDFSYPGLQEQTEDPSFLEFLRSIRG